MLYDKPERAGDICEVKNNCINAKYNKIILLNLLRNAIKWIIHTCNVDYCQNIYNIAEIQHNFY